MEVLVGRVFLPKIYNGDLSTVYQVHIFRISQEYGSKSKKDTLSHNIIAFYTAV